MAIEYVRCDECGRRVAMEFLVGNQILCVQCARDRVQDRPRRSREQLRSDLSAMIAAASKAMLHKIGGILPPNRVPSSINVVVPPKPDGPVCRPYRPTYTLDLNRDLLLDGMLPGETVVQFAERRDAERN